MLFEANQSPASKSDPVAVGLRAGDAAHHFVGDAHS